MIEKIKTLIQEGEKHMELLLYAITTVISISAIMYFSLNHGQNFSDYDAIARLNIARKMLDSLTPGIGQLGGIWLPFPQMLFMFFIWNSFLWHSGLAAGIVSGTAFIVASVYLYKTTLLLTKKRSIGVFVWFMFVSNSNLLLLQTMGMSESFFLFGQVMTMYFLTKWTQTKDHIDFLLAALFVMIVTLTRYEGYFIFIGAMMVVFLLSMIQFYKKEGLVKVEGMVLFFLSVAGYGIFLWCLYCALFYKDPLFWLHLYASGKGQVSSATSSVISATSDPTQVSSKAISLLTAFETYTGAILWTNGIITSLLGLLGAIVLGKTIKEKLSVNKSIRVYLPLGVIFVVLFGFLIYGYQKGFIPNIEYPPITLQHILSKTYNQYSHSNIRYGLILCPLLLLLAGFAAARNKILTILVVGLFAFQFYTNFFTPLFLQFSFPRSWEYQTLAGVSFFTSNYHGGLILISANRHENFMFQTNLPYKDFIYEGTRGYWTTSLNNPAKYASWVIFDTSIQGDSVTNFLTGYAQFVLEKKYLLVYNMHGLHIYHIKNPIATL